MDSNMLETPKINVIDARPEMLDPLCALFPKRDFQELARFLQQAQSGICNFLVAFKESNPLGYCLIYWQSEFPDFSKENTPEIVDLIIAKTERHKGYGHSLLLKIEQCAKEHGAQKVGLCVKKNNDAAYHLYKKAGYKIIHEDENGNLMMEKNLLS